MNNRKKITEEGYLLKIPYFKHIEIPGPPKNRKGISGYSRQEFNEIRRTFQT